MKLKDFREKYKEKIYIGDSVYVHFDGYHLILETRNGLPDDPSNVIGLEPPVFEKLVKYNKSLYEDIKSIDD